MTPPSIIGLSSEIGRGHPNYLDSVWTLLEREYPRPDAALAWWTLFERTSGIPHVGWCAVRRLYQAGGSGGLATFTYNALRHRRGAPGRGGLAVDLLGRDLRAALTGYNGICLVAHPILAQIASQVCRTWYIHGEIAAPPECAVRGVERVVAPLERTAERLVAAGAERSSMVVTGLVVEPDLVPNAEDAVRTRLERIRSGEPLTVGFFTSGAYPKEHMRMLVHAARSVVEQGMRAIIFCGTKASVFRRLRGKALDWGIPSAADSGADDQTMRDSFEERRLMLVHRGTRRALTRRAIELVPQLDLFVAAAHERTNWAVGLGLPMWVLLPHIGTFAAENFAFATERGVALPLGAEADAALLGQTIEKARTDRTLADMAQRGFRHLPIDGARHTAGLIMEEYSQGGGRAPSRQQEP